MEAIELYRRRAMDCARLRDLARSDMARRRLDRECADWLRLAHDERRAQTAPRH